MPRPVTPVAMATTLAEGKLGLVSASQVAVGKTNIFIDPPCHLLTQLTKIKGQEVRALLTIVSLKKAS